MSRCNWYVRDVWFSNSSPKTLFSQWKNKDWAQNFRNASCAKFFPLVCHHYRTTYGVSCPLGHLVDFRKLHLEITEDIKLEKAGSYLSLNALRAHQSHYKGPHNSLVYIKLQHNFKYQFLTIWTRFIQIHNTLSIWVAMPNSVWKKEALR